MTLRVLVVDDSVVVRRMLTDLITAERDMEVVAVAATASIGIQKISQVNPDIVILDVEMPEMDGIEAVRRIRGTWPRLPVVMCSSLTERSADVTLRALAAGASDYVAKPSATVPPDVFRTELITKLRVLGGTHALPPVMASRPTAMPRKPMVRTAPAVVAIGSSTGGPNALGVIMAKLPGDMAVPIVIVQHMPPLFTRLLAERLTATSAIRFVEASDGELIEPGRGYIAPGGYHMTVVREGTSQRVRLNQEPPENSCRPAVDVLFRSVARTYGPAVLGVVLTGMGHDGTRGSRDVVEAGGLVITQDAASSVVPSMPMSVASAGLSDAVRPLDGIAAEIVTRVRARETPNFARSITFGGST